MTTSWGPDDYKNWLLKLPEHPTEYQELCDEIFKNFKPKKYDAFVAHMKLSNLQVLGQYFAILLSIDESNPVICKLVHHTRELRKANGFQVSLSNCERLQKTFENSYAYNLYKSNLQLLLMIRQAIRKAEHEYYNNEFSSIKGDTKPTIPFQDDSKDTMAKNTIKELSAPVRIMFVGNCNSGKSTMMNVFLRPQLLLPMKNGPCTSALIELKHGTPETFQLPNSEKELYFSSPADYAQHVTFGPHTTPKEALDKVIIRANNPLLKYCTMVDAPGFADDPTITNLVLQAAADMDIVVITINGEGSLGQHNKQLIANLHAAKHQFKRNYGTFYICNKVDMIPPAEQKDKKASIKQEIEKALNSNTCSPSTTLEPIQLHFVNSLQAWNSYNQDYISIDKEFHTAEEDLLSYIDKIMLKRIRQKNKHVLLDLIVETLTYIDTLEKSAEVSKDVSKQMVFDECIAKVENSASILEQYKEECQIEIEALRKKYEACIRSFWKLHGEVVSSTNFEQKLTGHIESHHGLLEAYTSALSNITKNAKIESINNNLKYVTDSIKKPNMVLASISSGVVVVAGVGVAGIGVASGVLAAAAIVAGGALVVTSAVVLTGVGIYSLVQENKWKANASSEEKILSIASNSVATLSDELDKRYSETYKQNHDAEQRLRNWLINTRSTTDIGKTFGKQKENLLKLQNEIESSLQK